MSLPHIMSILLILKFKSLGGCGDLERTDFEQFVPSGEGLVAKKTTDFDPI